MTVASEHLHIKVPATFPIEQFDSFMGAAKSTLLPNKGDPWREFGGASNLIAWRYRACIEYFERYIHLWMNPPSAEPFEVIYERERVWFGAFVSGVSCIESTSYALYALSSHPKVLSVKFGVKEQRQCSPKTLVEVLRPHNRAETLVVTLDQMLSSSEWSHWSELRNRMAHRSNLPRIIYGGTGSSPPASKPVQFAGTSSTRETIGDEAWIASQCQWLSGCLKELLVSGARLASGV